MTTNKTETLSLSLLTEAAVLAVLTSPAPSGVLYIHSEVLPVGYLVVLRREADHYDGGPTTRTEWRLGGDTAWDFCPLHVAARVRRILAQAALEAALA